MLAIAPSSDVHPDKTPTGAPFFDERFGGVFPGRCWLLSGSAGTGKSAIALEFLAQGMRLDERVLLLTTQRAADTVLWAAGHTLGMDRAIESGQCLILEYADFIPGRDPEPDPSLPPEGFLDLQEIVRANSICRVVLDTVLPWAMTPHPPTQTERIFSLVRAFDRLQCTTLLTLPRPVSTMALRLQQAIETIVPVSVSLSLSLESGERAWQTDKYLGEAGPFSPVPYVLLPGRGARGAQDAAGEKPAPAKPAAPAPARARLAPALLGQDSLAGRAPDRSTRYGLSLPR